MDDRWLADLFPRLPQRQDSLEDQVRDLAAAAYRLGLFDAADWVKDRWNERTSGRRIR